MRNRRKHKDVLGQVLPPMAGPNTSLLVADIEVGVCGCTGQGV